MFKLLDKAVVYVALLMVGEEGDIELYGQLNLWDRARPRRMAMMVSQGILLALAGLALLAL